jgi:hypothetical protein
MTKPILMSMQQLDFSLTHASLASPSLGHEGCKGDSHSTCTHQVNGHRCREPRVRAHFSTLRSLLCTLSAHFSTLRSLLCTLSAHFSSLRALLNP